MSGFLFATGIENSYPTIAGGARVDQMRQCGHYERWKEDIALAAALGVDALRIGPAYYLIHESPGRYRWELFDGVAAELELAGIEPIVDLLHFGVPDWLGSFQNPDLPHYFSEYARAFARRYPRVHYYTPVNEILIAARFSAKYGWWNERATGDAHYAAALRNLVFANLRAMHAIRQECPEAVFVQPESFEHWHAGEPELQARADLENQLRFVGLDLTYGVQPGVLALDWLLGNGFSESDLTETRALAMVRGCIIGIDYYHTSEHVLLPGGKEAPCDDTLGLVEVARQYYNRYGLPLMHTETNRESSLAVDWLRKQWLGVLHLRRTGVPVVGFTWFSLTDQMDWDIALREIRGTVCTVGLADLDRTLRPVGAFYREIISQWKHAMPEAQVAACAEAAVHTLPKLAGR